MERKRKKAKRGYRLYLDSSQPVEKRVKDLLARMTLEEKVGQLGANPLDKILEVGRFSVQKLKKIIADLGFGVLHNIPKDFRLNLKIVQKVQRYLKEETRLGIPAIITGEGVHGHMSEGATIFPHGLALASTWNPDLVGKMSSVVAREARAVGVSQILSPVLDLSREPRWGRCQENYGEDPYLTSRMGVAYIKGLQGEGPAIDGEHCAATPKHFAAHGTPESGINIAPVHTGVRELRTEYLPPFKAAVCEAGAASIMNCYSEIDGIPCASSKGLLTGILRKEWGFKGYVYSDWQSIFMLHSLHHTANNLEEAGKQAIEAGLDLEAPIPEAYGKKLLNLVKQGKVSIKTIDQAASRILRLKFLLGLFENPYPDPGFAQTIRNCAEHKELVLQTARESITLLKNEGNILPLSKTVSSIAVIGPNADKAQVGNYSVPKEGMTTVLQGIKNKVSAGTQVYHSQGCGIFELSTEDIPEAVETARKADVIVLVLGESNQVCEEGIDQSDLRLPGVQLDLVKAICETGKPVVAVLYNGRPLDISYLAENIPVILETWYPGEDGGTAVAEILFGDYNPSGKLPVSLPRSTGHIPVYYNHKPNAKGVYHKPGSPGNPGRDYVFAPTTPLFEFGHGLSYTTFSYSNLRVSPAKISPSGQVKGSVEVTNTGDRSGTEVVQVYLRDVVSSVTTPVRMLKRFQKVELRPGEKKKVQFTLFPSDLELLNQQMKMVVEPGVFEVMVGGLTKKFEVR